MQTNFFAAFSIFRKLQFDRLSRRSTKIQRRTSDSNIFSFKLNIDFNRRVFIIFTTDLSFDQQNIFISQTWLSSIRTKSNFSSIQPPNWAPSFISYLRFSSVELGFQPFFTLTQWRSFHSLLEQDSQLQPLSCSRYFTFCQISTNKKKEINSAESFSHSKIVSTHFASNERHSFGLLTSWIVLINFSQLKVPSDFELRRRKLSTGLNNVSLSFSASKIVHRTEPIFLCASSTPEKWNKRDSGENWFSRQNAWPRKAVSIWRIPNDEKRTKRWKFFSRENEFVGFHCFADEFDEKWKSIVRWNRIFIFIGESFQ